MNITHHIPTRPAEFPPRSFVFYGEVKTGKSPLASQFPTPLMYNLEDRLHHVTADLVNDIPTPASLAESLTELDRDLRAGKLKYPTVVLDGFTTFLMAAQIRSTSKNPRQVAKEMAGQFIPLLQIFFDLPGVRIITMHSRSERYEQKAEGGTIAFRTEEPDASPRVAAFICKKADAIGYCHTLNNQPVVEWLPTDVVNVANKTGLKILAGNSLGLPRQTPLTYKALSALLVASSAPGKPDTAIAPPVVAPPVAEAPKSEAPQPPPATAPAPEPPPNGKSPAPEPFPADKNGLLAAIKKFKMPSTAVTLITPKNAATVYWTVVEAFKIDRQIATDISKEAHNDWSAALKGLDQHFAPF